MCAYCICVIYVFVLMPIGSEGRGNGSGLLQKGTKLPNLFKDVQEIQWKGWS